MQFIVIDSCDEVEAESEVSASVAVAVGEDVETLEPSEHIFDDDALAGEHPVVAFLRLCQLAFFGLLPGYQRVAVQLFQPLIAGIGKRTWRRTGNQKRRHVFLLDSLEKVDKLLKPVLRTRYRHGYQLADRSIGFPHYPILEEFQAAYPLPSRQLSLFAF